MGKAKTREEYGSDISDMGKLHSITLKLENDNGEGEISLLLHFLLFYCFIFWVEGVGREEGGYTEKDIASLTPFVLK